MLLPNSLSTVPIITGTEEESSGAAGSHAWRGSDLLSTVGPQFRPRPLPGAAGVGCNLRCARNPA
jgi:hypothetical protein